jgi:hypothetical protein
VDTTLVDRVETFRGYREILRRRFDQAAHAALEKVPEGGEWDGIQVLRRAELERVVHDFAKADPDPLATVAEVMTPARVFVDAICPRCGIPARILVEIHTELVVSDEGSEIRAKTKSKASSHVCGQLPLEPGADSDQLSFSDVRTRPELRLRYDVPKPDDVSLETPEADRCGATIQIAVPTEGAEPAGEETIVCERPIDHDQLAAEDARDHWAEGGFAWHYEEVPDLSIVEGETEDQEGGEE